MPQNFMINACVMLPTPERFEEKVGGFTLVAGYYRVFAVFAESSEQALSTVAAAITDGSIDWQDITVKQIDPDSLDDAIQAHCPLGRLSGIWYKSGRSYFPVE